MSSSEIFYIPPDKTSNNDAEVSHLHSQMLDVRSSIGAFGELLGQPTAANTSNEIVKRDSNGSFQAKAIQLESLTSLADLTLNPTGSILLGKEPTAPSHAVTKGYVDNIAAGLTWKQAVRLKTVAQLPAYTYSNNKTITGAGALTIDGVAVALNDRILVDQKNSPASHAGIYVVTQLSPFILERAFDADGTPVGEYVSGMCVTVTEGTTSKSTQWTLATANPITLGTTAQNWVMFSAGGTSDATPGTLMQRDANGDVKVRKLTANSSALIGSGSTGGFLRLNNSDAVKKLCIYDRANTGSSGDDQTNTSFYGFGVTIGDGAGEMNYHVPAGAKEQQE